MLCLVSWCGYIVHRNYGEAVALKIALVAIVEVRASLRVQRGYGMGTTSCSTSRQHRQLIFFHSPLKDFAVGLAVVLSHGETLDLLGSRVLTIQGVSY